jgi:hypothetical protein
MNGMARVMRRIGRLVRRDSSERDLREEFEAHLQFDVEDRIARGMSPAAARRTALIDFGGVERFKEEDRDARGVRLLEDLAQDARYAVRVLRKSPGFTVATIVTVAVGIAATTSVYSAVNAVMFRAPPVAEAGRLFVVSEVWKSGQKSYATYMAQSLYRVAHFRELHDRSTPSLSGLAGYRSGTARRMEHLACDLLHVACSDSHVASRTLPVTRGITQCTYD